MIPWPRLCSNCILVNNITEPWFAVLFVVATGVNSLAVLPEAIVNLLIAADTLFLTVGNGGIGSQNTYLCLASGWNPAIATGICFVHVTDHWRLYTQPEPHHFVS